MKISSQSIRSGKQANDNPKTAYRSNKVNEKTYPYISL